MLVEDVWKGTTEPLLTYASFAISKIKILRIAYEVLLALKLPLFSGFK